MTLSTSKDFDSLLESFMNPLEIVQDLHMLSQLPGNDIAHIPQPILLEILDNIDTNEDPKAIHDTLTPKLLELIAQHKPEGDTTDMAEVLRNEHQAAMQRRHKGL